VTSDDCAWLGGETGVDTVLFRDGCYAATRETAGHRIGREQRWLDVRRSLLVAEHDADGAA